MAVLWLLLGGVVATPFILYLGFFFVLVFPHVLTLRYFLEVVISLPSISKRLQNQKKFELWYDSENKLIANIVQNCKKLAPGQYVAPKWYALDPSGTLDTCFGKGFQDEIAPEVSYNRQILTLKDGGTVALDWPVRGAEYTREDGPKFSPPPTKTQRCTSLQPLVVIVHGLNEDSQTGQIRRLALHLFKHTDYSVVVLVQRGCGGLTLTTPEPNSAKGEDLEGVLEHLRAVCPHSPLLACAASLGGSMVANYMGQQGERCLLAAASICSVPWDFRDKTPIAYWWSAFLCQKEKGGSIREYIAAHGSTLVAAGKLTEQALKQAKKLKSLQEFNELVLAPTLGFKDGADYALNISPILRAPGITAPCLCLSAENDPVAPPQSFRAMTQKMGRGMVACMVGAGGHAGFPREGDIFDCYFNHLTVDWFAQLLKRV